MARVSRSLWVAIAATALLVLVVAVDASVNRTVVLEVEASGGWQTLASTGEDPYPRLGGDVLIEANETDEVPFRLRVDNEPPWAYEADYRVTVRGSLVAAGTLSAEGGGTGVATFSVTGEQLFEAATKGQPRSFPTSVEVQIDGDFLYASPSVEEVPR